MDKRRLLDEVTLNYDEKQRKKLEDKIKKQLEDKNRTDIETLRFLASEATKLDKNAGNMITKLDNLLTQVKLAESELKTTKEKMNIQEQKQIKKNVIAQFGNDSDSD